MVPFAINLHIMGIPEREERDKGTEAIFKTMMAQLFSKFMSDTKPTDLGASKNIKQDK